MTKAVPPQPIALKPGEDTLRPDLCVIGAGAAGLSVAAAAAAFGVSVVLIEKGQMGGECLNVGCVPSKALLAAAQRVADARAAAPFGIDAQAQASPQRVRDHIRETIAAIAPVDSVARFEGMGVRVLRAAARFTDPRTVIAGDLKVQPRRFVLAVGSTPAVPPIEGLTDTPFLTNETVFDLADIPAHLIIIGGGAIGMELAQAWRRLGAAVTLLEAQTILPREDPELVAVAATALRREGVDLREHVRIEKISHTPGEGFMVAMAHGLTLQGSHLLVATGRRARTDTLDLPAANVVTEAGGITVDAGLRTSNKKIYAIGDCAAGLPRLTHAANAMAGVVVRNALFRLPAKFDAEKMPRVIFTDPEIAVCGLTEAQAREKHRHIAIQRWPFADNDRARAERAIEGHVKLITDKKGKLLGVGIAGKNAGEMLPFWQLALDKKMTMRDIAGTVFPYPLMGEAGKRAATAHFLPLTQKPLLRRLIALLRKFG